jgi:Cu/Ag efflux pump CusA
MTTLLASLVVSLTVTPVLASYLLPKANFLKKEGDPLLLRWLKWADTTSCDSRCGTAQPCWSAVAVLVLVSVSCIVWMGGEFLPRSTKGRSRSPPWPRPA